MTMKAKHVLLSLLTTAAISIGLALPALARPAVLTGAEPGSRVNVRSAPSTRATSPHYGLVGDRVEVLRSIKGADGYTWYYVEFRSGAEGWVRGDFIRYANNNQLPKQATLIGAQPGSRVNVRSAPSTTASSPHYGVVGDRVQALRSTQGSDRFTWYYVRFRSGAEGWIRGDYVQLMP
jgi:serine/threonine protein kinase, bacterial